MSTGTHRLQRGGRIMSLSGLLALLIGGGLLLAYWKFSWYWRHWHDSHRLLFLVGAAALAVWGLQRLFTGFAPGRTRTQRLNLHRHRVLLPRPGLIYLGILAVFFVASLLGRSNMLMLVFALMVGPFVINGWITFTMLKRTEVSRHLPERTMAGEPTPVELTVHNRKRWLPLWLAAVRDHIAGDGEELDAGVLFFRIPPRGQRSHPYQMRLMRRGRYRLGPLQITTRFPLGLVERGLLFEVRDEILVHPRVGRITENWKRGTVLAAELVQRESPRRGLFDDEFYRIREFRWGDNPRAIHWRSSARHNELMVREFRQSRHENLFVILDLWQPARPDEQTRERVELAVSFAATVCVEHMKQCRDSYLFLACCGRHRTQWEGRAGPAGIESLLDHLADVQAGPSSSPAEALADARLSRSPGMRNLLITTRRDRAANVPEVAQGSHSGGDWQIIEASWDELAPFFHIEQPVNEAPGPEAHEHSAG